MPVAYVRKVEYLARDLDSIGASSRTAATNAMRGAAKRLLPIARALTPVDTGYMQSRWQTRNKSWGASVRNDTWYLPWVNRDAHPGFAERIATYAPKLMRQELKKVRLSSTIGRRELKLEYSRKYSRALKYDQGQLAEYQDRKVSD